jgi:hypothetical protein
MNQNVPERKTVSSCANVIKVSALQLCTSYQMLYDGMIMRVY